MSDDRAGAGAAAGDADDSPYDPFVAAEKARRRRGRWRAARHAFVLLLVIGLVGGVGVVAGGAILGRWPLPELPFLAQPSAEPSVQAEPSGPPPPPCDPPLVTGVEPAAVTVRVLNATSTEGLAGGMQAELAARGLVIADIGNFSREVPEPAVVRFPPASEAQAITVAAQVQGAVLSLDPAADVVTLTLGDAYLGVRPPEEAAVIVATPVPSLLGCPLVPDPAGPVDPAAPADPAAPVDPPAPVDPAAPADPAP